MKQIFFKVIAGCVVVLCLAAYRSYRIDEPALKQCIRQGAVIIDVRTPREFRQGHIAGAVNIRLSELGNAPLGFPKQQYLITCCSHGLRSIRAQGILKSRGYVHTVNGGAWADLERYLPQDRR